MKRLCLLFVLMLIAVPLSAQDDAKPETDNEADAADEETEDEEAEEEEIGIPVDFNEYLKSKNPSLDPGGRHDIFDLRNPKDRDERHEYVNAMTQIVIAYMDELGMGATVAKLFDQYSRGEHGNDPVFKVLHAVVLRYYPPGQPNLTQMQNLLREAAAVGDFAFPNYMLAQVEYERFRQVPNTSPKPALDLLDAAIELRPDFLNAVLLKSQVFMAAKPPKSEEVRRMIRPWTEDKLPAHPDDFENLMKMYAQSHTTSDLHSKINGLIESNRLSRPQRVRALQLLGSSHLSNMEVEKAIDVFAESLKYIDAARHPAAAIRSERSLAVCKFGRLQLIQRNDPELTDPENRKLYDELHDAIRAHHENCTEIEKKYLPKALRGSEARTYAILLAQDLGKPEEALLWLGKYLDETELSGPQRRTLLNLHANIGITVDPTEENLIERFENFKAADDMMNLAKSFAIARASVINDGRHFTLNRALNLFIDEIENRERLIAMDAAFLAADTARQIGDEAVARAGAAIAERFGKETEISSDAQAEFIEDVGRTVREFGDRASQERVTRHLAIIIEDTELITNLRMSRVLAVWTDDAFLREIENTPAKPGLFDRRKPDRVAAWLNKLAEAIKAEGENANE